jgi:hypothetical protein
VLHTMGAGASSYEDRQKQAFLQEERKKKRAIKREADRARKAEEEARGSERDAWLKSQRSQSGDDGWWPLGWLKWPFRWWKEKKAWKREEAKRARERNRDHELTGLTSAGLIETLREEGPQASGIASGGPIAENGRLRKRKGASGN